MSKNQEEFKRNTLFFEGSKVAKASKVKRGFE